MGYSDYYLISPSGERKLFRGIRKRFKRKRREVRTVVKWRKLIGNEVVDLLEKSNTYIIAEEDKTYIDKEKRIKTIDQFDLKIPQIGQSFLVKEIAENRKIIIEIAKGNDFSYKDHIYLNPESPIALAVCNIDKGEHFTVDCKSYQIVEYY